MVTRSHSASRGSANRQAVQDFVELELKELRGEALTPQEVEVLLRTEALMLLVPGSVEEAALAYALEKLPAQEFRVAASSHDDADTWVRAIDEAIREGRSVLVVGVGTESLPLFRLDAAEGLVQPCYQDGYVFVIERRDQPAQTVSSLGGVFITIDDLRRMKLVFELERDRIRLVER